MKKLPDKQVWLIADVVIGSKGFPCSQSEFNMIYSNASGRLKKMDATKRQMNLFKKLIEEAPIKGGRFNCYSGD